MELERYLVAAHPAFEAAQESASRLAALLITSALKGSRHELDRPGRASGLEATEAARDLPAPPPAAAHFHHHLTRGTAHLRQAWTQAEAMRVGLVAADPLPALKSAWEELRHASHALPGFQIVDFSLSCCALHRTP